MFLSSNVFIAIWVKDGVALSTISSILILDVAYIYYFVRFQMPGPVSTTVPVPDLKSGIPKDVEQPAPVKRIGYFAFFITFANYLTLLWIIS